MALIILDPNLEGEAGHHLAYDLAIAKEALARGEPATIIANRRFGARTIEGVRVLPHFTETCYAVRHQDPVTGAFDDFRHFNDLLQAELATLPRGEFRPSDCVLVPTVTENHLAGYVGWMKGFDPLEAPLFLVHLMLPSGYAVEGHGRQAVEDRLRALFYRLADRAAQEPGPEVHLFASGGQHAAEYGALLGRTIPPHPVPIRPEPAPRAGEPPRRALLFAGDVRTDKGIALLPDLGPALATAHPDWTFVAHANTEAAWGEAKAAGERLAALAEDFTNLEVAGGRLSPQAYLALLQGVRIALFPYDPALYRRKSSGVLWEAISLGVPVVVPEGTWLEYEARHWGAGHVAYRAHDPAAIAAAFEAALPRIEELEQASAVAGERYRAANGAAALMDQIAALWVRHKAVSSLVTRPRSMALDLTRLEAGWHRPETVEGRQVRWTAQEPVIAFDWPFDEPWEAELTLLSFFGTEQLQKVTATVGEAPVALDWSRDGRGGRLVLRGPGAGRARPRVELRLRLPYTYRPANDARDLGVLVAGLRVGPTAGEAVTAAERPFARVLAAPAEAGGWPVAPALSGEVLAEADVPCVLAFRLRAGSVPAARGLSLFVNGAPLPLTVSAEPGGSWLATATLPPALLRRAGVAAWDLVQEGGGTGPAPVLLSVGAAGAAGTLTLVAPAEEALSAQAEAEPMAGAVEEAEAAPEDAADTAPVQAPSPEGPQPVAEPAALVEPRIRWDLCAGIGPEEGPFPDLGLPAGVRWIVAREARLVVEAAAEGALPLTLGYRSLLPRQSIRVALNGGPEASLETTAAGLRESGEMVLDLALRPGANELRLGFAGAVREPGSGRELVLLIERIALG
ncbi:hypothetical protein GXW74_23345 [Roseomonas eburnea]|uniref:Glycosyltransferase family 1 protein n=1 Tax=Neoroseomonas eburnea TaxID=1346889 RepID=A0A9X9XIA5_9PROT|nr:hypothetical protein [Neoroseomonas eburnea]MBR0683441.1 hypothetical protein [Neoroseomonas eburnea]